MFRSKGEIALTSKALPCPEVDILQEANQLRITTDRVRLTVNLQGFFCQWEVKQNGLWQTAAADRSTQSYNFGWWDERVYHYLRRRGG